jgi:hypothetical protein
MPLTSSCLTGRAARGASSSIELDCGPRAPHDRSGLQRRGSRPARLLRRGLPALALALFAGLAGASPDAGAQREIDHLLDYIGASHCTFVRNGERFDAAKAREHLAMKLNFVRWRLSTADEFVRYLATESSVTHEPYLIVCGNRERPAGPWLASELAHYRKLERTAAR